MLLNERDTDEGVLVSVCDPEILGQTFEDGSVSITVDPEFYEGEEATEQEIVRELAWVCNQDLPRIPIKEKSLQQWLTDDEWDIPGNLEEDADANVTWAATHLPRVGKMNYSG